MEGNNKRQRITLDILQRLIPMGGVGASILVDIMKTLSVAEAYAICGPFNHEIFEFCEHHEVWKAYALRTLGERKVAEYEFILQPILQRIKGKLNYLWVVVIHAAVTRVENELQNVEFGDSAILLRGPMVIGRDERHLLGQLQITKDTSVRDPSKRVYEVNFTQASIVHSHRLLLVKAVAAMDMYCTMESLRILSVNVIGDLAGTWTFGLVCILYYLLALPGIYLEIEPGTKRGIRSELKV